MCGKILANGNKCQKPLFKEDLCRFHYNKIHKNSEKIILEYEGETKECSSEKHRLSDSQYSKEKVPIEKFMKVENNGTYKMCIDCREYVSISIKNKKNKFKEQQNRIEENSEFFVCQSVIHEYNGISKYPRDKVPKEMFLKDPRNLNFFLKSCSDCRNYDNIQHEKSFERKREFCEKNEMFFCSSCKKNKNKEERSTNLDGFESQSCKSCHEKKFIINKKDQENKKKNYREAQFKYILENETCCKICNSIFLNPLDESFYCIEIPIQIIDEEKKVTYNDKIYNVREFINEYKNLIEYRILDFDHLPEEELEGKKYIKKKNNVSNIKNKLDLIEEVEKCQLVCCKCHIKITINREQGGHIISQKRQEKTDYVNEIKKQGCSVCEFKDETLLRFFEFDHLEPNNKIEGISKMIRMNEYRLEDVKLEISKTRLLCRNCHRIHTDWQRKQEKNK